MFSNRSKLESQQLARKISKIALILLIFSSLQFCHYIELKIYPPLPNKKFVPDQPKNTSISWVDDTGLGTNLAYHNPSIFSPRFLENEFGGLVYILDREVSNHPDIYPSLHKNGSTKIHLKEFRLNTNDSCFSNLTSINIRLEVTKNNKIYPFTYKDEIHSSVTDCYLVGSTLLIVPLVVYVPYQGFRGTREDQLNQLGRNGLKAILDFFQSDLQLSSEAKE
ncbi:hypothetical protein [Leptospira sp. GIMC2001]|uniref:hypothetical protein n=1 Tax=Leptospira sp. GIMC2001 TaxID=1513297 RepID=UPI002349F1D6|nr:hypothetical protein [Leptospira sp. GIMC2001]WCL47764.1 hypothetical protein O4O04_00470 [Leptospira sp. GIMC2001]